jgi:hypothetical protein
MKKVLVVLFAVILLLVILGFSWGGVGGMPMSMRQDNRVNYWPRAVYGFSGEVCYLLPFEAYYTDGFPAGIINGDVGIFVNSGRCYGVTR